MSLKAGYICQLCGADRIDEMAAECAADLQRERDER